MVGAGSDVGQIASLFLKQHKVIKILAMYDDVPERFVMGVANDLAHIDTSTEVEAYQGRVFLKSALYVRISLKKQCDTNLVAIYTPLVIISFRP